MYSTLLIRLHTVKWFHVLLYMTNNSIKHQSFVYAQLNNQFYFYQFNQPLVIPLNSFFSDRTLSGATTSGQSRPGSDGNERVLRISQSSIISGASQSDYLISYPEPSLGSGSYLFAEIQLVYSIAPADWVCRLYGDKDEMINPIICECSKLKQREYKTKYDWVGNVIDRELCKTLKFDHNTNICTTSENETENLSGIL